jgi:CubicO group peptidase (beta-lactamase class C family)
LVGTIVLVAAVAAAAFQAAAVRTPAPLALDGQSLSAFLEAEVAARGLVGLSLAVMRDGRMIYAGGAGRSAIETNAPVTPETRFAIGSITKQFTSACILLLAEDGKLAVQDRVAKWYPGLTAASDITLLDLMNHVSGYPDYYPLDFVDRPMQKPIKVDDLIQTFGTRPLDFPPGSRYSYSNTGFVILGRIVEKVSGEPFGAFLERRVLRPLGMTHTAYEPEAPTGPGFAHGYVTFALGPPETATPEGRGWVAAAGALYSTPSDLATWDLALMDGKVLKADSYRVMTAPRKLSDGSMSDYGCGLAIGRRGDQQVLGHNGAVAGFYAQNTMVPATRSAAVLLSNFDASAAVNATYARVLNALAPRPPSPTAKPAGEAAKKPGPSGVPAIAGPPATEAARLLFLALQKGQVDRARLGEEYSAFLTDAKIRGASTRLEPYGEPGKVALQSASERGGMEVTYTRLVFAKGILQGLMYRTPDGKVQQFFVLKE